MQKVYQRINWENEPSTNTPISEDNLNKMDYAIDTLDSRVVSLYGYQDRVEQAEKNAKTSETNAKTSETNAKQSEEKAKEYMENAFNGTPEGYQEVVEKVDRMEIKTTKENTIKGTKNGGFRLTKVVANTIQNGTPSPSTPVPLLSTGECVELIQGYYTTGNGAYATNSNGVCTKNKIPCKSGDNIGIGLGSAKDVFVMFYNNDTYMSYLAQGATTNAQFTVPSGVTHFNTNIMDGNGITPNTVGKITLTINGKYVVPIKTHGKNFLNVPKVITFTNKGYAFNTKMKLKVNTTYTFSLISSVSDTASTQFACLYKDGTAEYFPTPHLVANQRVSVSFTPKKEIDDILYYVNLANVTLTDCQIEEGTVATEYAEYRETVAHILTNEPPRLGDIFYKENGLWKLEHNTTERIFTDKNAGWMQANNIAGHAGVFFTQTYKTDYVYPQYPLCETFSQASGYSDVSNYTCAIDKTGSFWVCNDDITTIQDFATWVAENPIKAQYKLATPIIEVLDTDSQIALNGLETFEGVTHIEFDTMVQPLEFEAEVGTSQVGAYTLKSLNNSESNAVRLNELAVALVSL